jgi:hypothetical protein
VSSFEFFFLQARVFMGACGPICHLFVFEIFSKEKLALQLMLTLNLLNKLLLAITFFFTENIPNQK